jgi:hypothetical protein
MRPLFDAISGGLAALAILALVSDRPSDPEVQEILTPGSLFPGRCVIVTLDVMGPVPFIASSVSSSSPWSE